MNRTEFFEEVLINSQKNPVITLLELRGFLIDEEGGKYYLSNNNHISDKNYLEELLNRYQIGELIGKEIIISNTEIKEFIRNEFSEKQIIQMESCWQDKKWRTFYKRECGGKVRVEWLEPFVARYVKAISACGVSTVGSCDGNHPKGEKVLLMMDNCSRIWHQIIWESLLMSKFNICWNDKFDEMIFADSKYELYMEIYKASNYLYENRLALREIKKASFNGMTECYIRHHDAKEVEANFIKEAKLLLFNI